MPKKTQKLKQSVLDKDTAYPFPHLLVLDASAGAGKTHALVGRYVQFLLSSHIPQNDLPNLLAITFTRKAAEEMKTRVLDWLKQIALGLSPEKTAETLALVDISPLDLA
jgi:ATP-dependent exoDNAse (exonuclease V) beta subunit